jgi:hypothetical protein
MGSGLGSKAEFAFRVRTDLNRLAIYSMQILGTCRCVDVTAQPFFMSPDAHGCRFTNRQGRARARSWPDFCQVLVYFFTTGG